MRRKKMAAVLWISLAVLAVIGVTAYAASNYGSQEDPLVTRSYLTDKLTPGILEQVQEEIDKSVAGLEQTINDAISENSPGTFETYRLVLLGDGAVLVGKVGSEIMLRDGFANAVCISGLADISSGETLQNGEALSANHMYILSSDGDGVRAVSGDAELFVRGEFTIS